MIEISVAQSGSTFPWTIKAHTVPRVGELVFNDTAGAHRVVSVAWMPQKDGLHSPVLFVERLTATERLPELTVFLPGS